MSHFSRLGFVAVIGLFTACGGGSGSTSGTGGAGGDSGGAGGDSGGGGNGGGATFKALAPCLQESDFVEAATVMFPNADMSYVPKCIKVASGSMVTFTATSGDFSVHPLEASRYRGRMADNPLVTSPTTDTSVSFVPTTVGSFGFYCRYHGDDMTGEGEAGVLWVY